MPVKKVAQRTVVPSKMDLQFQVDQVRKDKMIYALNALMVSFICVLTAVFLPEILFRAFYGNPKIQLDANVLSWIPAGSYLVALVFTLYAGVGNIMRCFKVKKLEEALQSTVR